MQFDVRETTPHPRSVVFATHRDRLPDIVKYLDEVASVELRSRSLHAGGREEQVHLWVGTPAALPALIRPFVAPQLLTWKQKTVWDPFTWSATWEIDVLALGPAIEARGTNRYLEDGSGCTIEITGEFAFRPDKVPQLAQVPATAVPMVEKAVVALIVPLVKRTGTAVARFLDEERARQG